MNGSKFRGWKSILVFSMMDRQRFQVVYPVLPMDLLGVYVLFPE
jgi:hypothetical protein